MKLCNVTSKEFMDIVVSGDEIICWGVGKNADKCITELGIYDKVKYFVDSNPEKWGSQYKDRDVCNPRKLEGEKGILLITPKLYFDILRGIWDKYDGLEVYCYEMMQPFQFDIDCLEDIWYYSRMIKPSIDRYIHNLQDEGLDEESIRNAVEKKGSEIGKKINGEYPLILPRLVLFVTEKCTLRCQGCSAFVDKFKSPQHADADKLIAGMKKIFANIDGCMNIQLGGGEIFLYPQLKEILLYLLAEEKCEKIGIITNGTIVPEDEIVKILAENKIVVEMSDYGLIDIQAKVIRKLEEYKVNLKVFSEQKWLDYGDPELKLEKPVKQLKHEYFTCPDGYMCKPFDGDRIYSCGRCLRMHHINVQGYDHEKDSCRIECDDLKENIRTFYLREYAEACDYCARMQKPPAWISVGVQPNKAFQKSEYTIISRSELLRLRNAAGDKSV